MAAASHLLPKAYQTAIFEEVMDHIMSELKKVGKLEVDEKKNVTKI